MAFNFNIKKGAVIKAPRIQILATQGFGKTSFAACYADEGQNPTEETDTTLLIPVKGETGADGLEVAKTETAKSYRQLIGMIVELGSEDHSFTRVVLDSTSAIEPIINEEVCFRHDVDNVKKVKGFRVGEAEVAKCWHELLAALDVLRDKGIEVVITTHVKVKAFADPENDKYDRYVADLDESNAGIIDKWCDIVAFGKTDIVVRTEEVGFGGERKRADQIDRRRWLYMTPSATHPGKRRPEFSRMPDKILLDHNEFRKAMIEATKTLKKA